MKLRILKRLNTLLLCLLFGFSLAACGGGGGDDSSTAQMGTVSLSITDNPGLYNAVVLSIEKVGVVTNNSATVYYNSADISELPVTVDILDFPDEATLFLGDIEVPLPDSGEVCINQIRLVLADKGNYVIENSDSEIIPGIRHDLKAPSGQQSGVKLLVKEEAFCLSRDDDAVNVTIEFDPATAIIVKENSANPYQLKPTSMRIITGDFFKAESFIAGEVRVPTYNTAGVCDTFAMSPVVTVEAYNSAILTSKTVALLADDPDREGDFCYYSGAFKLLLPDKETYNLTATWDAFKAEEPGVTYNSTALVLDLTEQ